MVVSSELLACCPSLLRPRARAARLLLAVADCPPAPPLTPLLCPPPAAVDASDDSFRFYSGGLYHNPDCKVRLQLAEAGRVHWTGAVQRGSALSAAAACGRPRCGRPRSCLNGINCLSTHQAGGARGPGPRRHHQRLRHRRRWPGVLAGEEHLEHVLGEERAWLLLLTGLPLSGLLMLMCRVGWSHCVCSCASLALLCLPACAAYMPTSCLSPSSLIAGRERLPAGHAQGQRLRRGL